MTSRLIEAHYQNLTVHFTEAGWFNATVVVAHYGRCPNDWLALDSTQDYLATLAELAQCDKAALVKSQRSGNQRANTRNSGNGGTWFHPKLAVPFARWLDVRFAIWCDLQIDALVRGTHVHYDWLRLRHEVRASHKVMA